MDEPSDDLALDPEGELPWRGSDADEEDLHDREVRAKLRAMIVGETHQPLHVGRFRLLRKLGQGGMGTVYAAHDDALDREVALKLLHPGHRHDERATQRLRREAMTLARLSHPNLVPVFEVGEFEGQVFLAMELVAGVTMDAWVREQPRAWQQVLGHWLDVARALAVVHDAALVHRDIKPNNVLIGPDDRARLVDFGLVRGHVDNDDGASISARDASRLFTASPDETDTQVDAEPRERARGSSQQQLITLPDAILGTLAYMAPEQRAGAIAGPRADQFSLCMSIYECLYGRRPPPVARAGELVEVPDPKAVPVAVRRALTRGVARAPEDRFADVHALVHALERASAPRTRWWLLGGAVLLAAVAGGVVTRALDPPTATMPDPCAAIDDDLDGVWDSPHRDALRTAIMATEVPYAAPMSQQLDRLLQDYAATWLHARRGTCEATRVQRVQSDVLLDRRMACLDGQRRSLAAMLEVATTVTPSQLPRLPMMVAELGDPSECLDDALVNRSLPAPDPNVSEEVERLRGTIAQLRYEAVLAGPEHVWPFAEQAAARAEQIGYRPLQAEASLLLGALYQQADDPRARIHLERADDLATSVDHVQARDEALQQLVRLTIDVDLDARAAKRLLEQDFAVIQRLGGSTPRLASALGLRAALAMLADDPVTAQADLREAVAILQAQGERQAPALATVSRDLGNLLVGRGRFDEAQAQFARADQLDADWGGVDLQASSGHTLRGHAELVRGVAATRAGQLDEAASWLARARHESGVSYGEQSVPVGRVEMAMADLALQHGRLEDVLVHARAADACFRRWLGEDHQLRASPMAAIGTVAFHLGHAEDSVAAFREELRLWLLVLPAHGVTVATARSNLGEALVLAGRDDEAAPVLAQALADLERSLPATDPLLSFPAHALAEIAWKHKDFETADRQARRALALREQHPDDPIELARTRWLLAQVQRELAQPEQARRLAEAARDGFGQLGPAFVEQAQQIDHWLGSLPRDRRTIP